LNARFFLNLDKTAAEQKDTSTPDLTGYDVDGVAAHPGCVHGEPCPSPTFDVALLHLDRPVEDVAPLPTAGEGPAVGALCEVVGVGMHMVNGKRAPVEKRKASVRVLGSDDVNVEAVMVDGIPDSGDSGGPLLCEGVIAGVVRCHHDGPWPQHRREFFTRVDPV